MKVRGALVQDRMNTSWRSRCPKDLLPHSLPFSTISLVERVKCVHLVCSDLRRMTMGVGGTAGMFSGLITLALRMDGTARRSCGTIVLTPFLPLRGLAFSWRLTENTSGKGTPLSIYVCLLTLLFQGSHPIVFFAR